MWTAGFLVSGRYSNVGPLTQNMVLSALCRRFGETLPVTPPGVHFPDQFGSDELLIL